MSKRALQSRPRGTLILARVPLLFVSAGRWRACNAAVFPSAFILILFVAVGMAVEKPNASVRTTADGVYTETKAKRGERTHRRACGHCHIDDFYTGGLIDAWIGNSVGALNKLIVNTMPEDRPSSLKPEQYADIMAFLLKINDFPAGEVELPSEDSALAKIILQRSEQ